jgi:hypothetical protein
VEEISPYLSSVNFAMPAIQEGSVIDVTYSIRSPFLFTMPVWFFQREYPTVFSELHLFIPEYFNYKPLQQGFLNLSNRTHTSRDKSVEIVWHETHNTSGGRGTRRSESLKYRENFLTYRIDNAPAFTTEPHMNAVINYLTKIEHELSFYRSPSGPSTDYSSTWAQLNTRLLESESFGRMLNRSGFLTNEVSAIMAKYEKPEEPMVAAYELIQSSMAWNRVNSIYAGRSLRRVWTEKAGNSADVNLILVNLLRELNIDAHPVILSTRSNGIINPAQIMLDKFNYVIAFANLDGKTFLMDATDKHTPYFLLPQKCINGEGRVVDERGGRWIKLEPAGENHSLTQSSVKVKPCGSMEITRRQELNNYYRLERESTLRNYNREEYYIDSFESAHQGIDVTDFSVENKDDWQLPMVTNFTFEINNTDGQPKEVIYVNPLLTDRLQANPFRLEDRQFPVDFVYPQRSTYTVNIEIPQGYTVDELPRNHSFGMSQNAARYAVNYTLDENGSIQVKIDMMMGKAVFSPTEYAALRNFHAQVIEEQARNIVLKKL